MNPEIFHTQRGKRRLARVDGVPAFFDHAGEGSATHAMVDATVAPIVARLRDLGAEPYVSCSGMEIDHPGDNSVRTFNAYICCRKGTSAIRKAARLAGFWNVEKNYTGPGRGQTNLYVSRAPPQILGRLPQYESQESLQHKWEGFLFFLNKIV